MFSLMFYHSSFKVLHSLLDTAWDTELSFIKISLNFELSNKFLSFFSIFYIFILYFKIPLYSNSIFHKSSFRLSTVIIFKTFLTYSDISWCYIWYHHYLASSSEHTALQKILSGEGTTANYIAWSRIIRFSFIHVSHWCFTILALKFFILCCWILRGHWFYLLSKFLWILIFLINFYHFSVTFIFSFVC